MQDDLKTQELARSVLELVRVDRQDDEDGE
jgi:hypothetical protein